MTSKKMKTEEEEVLFEEQTKLFRFLEKEWRERGTGVMKLLHSASLRSVRVLMRRNQTHKICAHHLVSSQVELLPMETLDKGWLWTAQDYADEELRIERFCCRFKTKEIATKFGEAFVKAKAIAKEREESSVHQVKEEKDAAPAESSAKKRRNPFSMAHVINTGTSYRNTLRWAKEKKKERRQLKSLETSADIGQSAKKRKPNPVDELFRAREKERYIQLLECFGTSADIGQSAKKMKPDPVDAFLAVIAPTLKSLTPQLWNIAKSELFASVQKYEKEMLVKDHP